MRIGRCSTRAGRISLATALLIAAHVLVGTSPGQTPETKHQRELATIEERATALKKEQSEVGRQLLSEHPDDFEALRIMGVVHRSQGNRAEMAECWLRCRELKPDRPDVCAQLAEYFMGLEEYEKAIGYWENSLAIDQTYPGANRQIGAALLKMGRPDEARNALQRAIEPDSKDGEAHYLLGEACYALQDFAKAKQRYEMAVSVQSETTPTWRSKAWYGLIKTCGRLGDAESLQRATKEFQRLQAAGAEADQEFRRRFDDLTQMKKNVAITCVDAGKFYAQEGKFDRSDKLWRRACELDTQNVEPHKLLAKLYLGQKKPADSLRHFKEVVRMNRGSAEVHQQIGFLEARLGNMLEAERSFEKAITAAPESAVGYRSLSKFYLNTKRQPQRAHKLAQKAVELAPTGESYFVLGWSCAVNGQRAEAIAALEKATELKPNNPTYRKLYEMVRGEK